MGITRYKVYLAILFIVAWIKLPAQRYDNLLEKLDAGYPQEKLYFQFDRSVYVPGDTIWFKAYLFTGSLPSLISKTLYTELIDGKGKVLRRIISPFIKSGGAGSLDIPTNVTGPLLLRAYTQWMLNFDSSFLYTKELSIISAQKAGDKLLPSSRGKTDTAKTILNPTILKFFPEGGDLVQGIESLVAFKATDQYGLPINVAGNIFNSDGKKITSFSSIHDGMGSFLLLPATGEQYKAVWNDDLGQIHQLILPSAKPSGIGLQVINLGKHLEFKIIRSPDMPSYSYVYVVAQINQRLLYMAKVSLKNASATGLIPLGNVAPGITQVTVFSPDEQPLAERIVFANSSRYSFITELTSPVTDVGKRQRNVIEINIPDTLACNLSVSVTDADLNPVEEEDNIYSHLLLTGDIKGYVHNPAYYFSNASDSVASHLDLVMMTNGWRRFKWEMVLAGQFPKIRYKPEDYISIQGQVLGLNKSLPAGKEISAIIELKNNNRQLLSIPIQENGSFMISGLIFYDTAKFFYQLNNDKNRSLTSKASFEIKNDILKDPPDFQPGNSVLFSLNDTGTISLIKYKQNFDQQLEIRGTQNTKVLKTVVVTALKKTKKEMADEEYTSGLFSGGGDHIFIPEEDPSFLSSKNVLNFLRGKIGGLVIGAGYEITWRGFPTMIFIDEIREEDLTRITALRMSDIAMIKVFNPPFYGAVGGGPGGAIAIYLKRKADIHPAAKGLDYVNISGYSIVKEFYSPDYSKPVSTNTNEPDFRTTLYWNPFVFIDKNHRSISLPFYNNDITKKMKVIIEGCNDEGRLTRVEKIFY
jgi:Large extracellular alpha-helical protein